MRKTSIVTLGIGAIAAVSLALLAPAGAGAAQIPSTTTTTRTPTLIEAVCGKLPTLLQNVTDNLPRAEAALDAARQNVEAKRAAMTTAMADMAVAVVDHLAVLDAVWQPHRLRQHPQGQAGPLRRLGRRLEQGPHPTVRRRAAPRLRRAPADPDRRGEHRHLLT